MLIYLILILIPLNEAFCPEQKESLSGESVLGALIEKPLDTDGSYLLSETIPVPEERSFKNITVCMWIRPKDFRGQIFQLDSVTNDGAASVVFSVRIVPETISLEGFMSNGSLSGVVLNEWTHLCVVYGYKVYVFLTLPLDGQKIIEFYGSFTDIISALKLKAFVGSDINVEEPMVGIYADVRIYLDLLTKEEIEKVSKFEDIDKKHYSIFETSPIGFSNESATNIQSVNIAKSSIIEPYNEFMLWYFQEKLSCEASMKLCERLNGRLLSPELSRENKNLLKGYLKCINKIDPFWVFDTKKCSQKLYRNDEMQSAFGAIPIASPLCIISKKQMYYFRSDDEIFSFQATPNVLKNIYIFENPKENLEMKYDAKNGVMFYSEYGEHRKMVQIKNFLLMGRYKWESLPDKKVSRLSSFSACGREEFTCTDGECVSMKNVCNSIHDCEDHSDENYCQVGINPDAYYEKRWVPSPLEGVFSAVSVRLQLNRVLKISIEDNSITLNLHLEVSWKDSRLRFKHLNEYGIRREIVASLASKYWNPKISLPTAVSSDAKAFHFNENPGIVYATLCSNHTRKLQVYGGYDAFVYNGEDVLLTEEKTADIKFVCKINLFAYPFDKQKCEIPLLLENLESQPSKVVWDDTQKEITALEHAAPNLYTNLSFSLSSSHQSNSSMMKVTFSVHRNNDGYIFIIFLPCIIMVLIGDLTFFMPYYDYADRVTVTLSSLIVMAALFTQVSSSLPSTSEPKLIDIWMFCHVFVLFLVFLFTVIVMSLHHKATKNENKQNQIIRPNIRSGGCCNIFRNLKLKYNRGVSDVTSVEAAMKSRYINCLQKSKPKKYYAIVNTLALFFCTTVYILFMIAFFASAFIQN